MRKLSILERRVNVFTSGFKEVGRRKVGIL